jgi:UDP-N-acetylmuramyl pentapeptide phosphotransferase/UDP-N-acetylglucosamine-1-phosphate transferase
VYVLLITPFVVLVIFGLTVVGLVDNWFDLRASVRPQT